MSPVCPRCGGELRPASINAWVHVWQDKEDDCYKPIPSLPLPDGTTTEPSHPNVAIGDSLPTEAERFKAMDQNRDAVVDAERQRRTAEDEVFGWTPITVRSALNERRLPSDVYQRLVTYAALYVPSAVYQEKRYGRTVLSYRRPLTDAEITEALR